MKIPAPHGLTAIKFLWKQYGPIAQFTPLPEEAWLNEFFFCLLGGYGIPFELNRSAFSVLKEKGYFEPHMYRGCVDKLRSRLEMELRALQFTPLRKDGTFRSYRFPRRKAKIVVEAGCWLLQTCQFRLGSILASDPRQSREILLECPGFGYKTASWFLRNIGHGNGLAILDVHVYRTLKDLAVIPPTLAVESDYLEIESLFCNVCATIGARADVMDLILWTWARGGVREQTHCYTTL